MWWASENSSGFTGDPKAKGFQYLGIYNATRRRMGMGGTSIEFGAPPKCRYLMFINNGGWHGTDFLNKLDIFIK